MKLKSPIRLLALALTLALLTVSFPADVFAKTEEQDPSEGGISDAG